MVDGAGPDGSAPAAGAGNTAPPAGEAASLPPFLAGLRGRVAAEAVLGPQTWFRTGGPAEWLVRPADLDDLLALLRALPAEVPLTVLGAASNLIIRDGGLRGVVLRLARGFSEITRDGDGFVAGSAVLDATLAEVAAAASMTGLEFFSGIPGSIGGAVAMNAGAYGREVCDVLDWAEIATPTGLRRLVAAEFAFRYRHATLPERGIVTRARFRVSPGDASAIASRMGEIRQSREATQPVRARTGGSTFKNPPGDKAWRLIDAAGCRGLQIGGAQVSEKHCNFLLNLGGATAAEVEELGEVVRARVLSMSGISLEWEIKRLGEKAR
ncbi:UDP-N-acetylmuramate dehydrogenase [Roseomonas elaeocarpi]|uniref:UDP-N-acetylenolpyruvoylglucosamine reductase n=1 Tax=Roseomonas elaeocarpi TaxID=907779 RepID=A0ABV6JXA4_9PROT